MDKLEPCPICNGEAVLVSVPCKRGISPYYWWVRCRNGCLSTHAYTSDHDAVEVWNKIAKRIGEGEKYYAELDDPKIAERSDHSVGLRLKEPLTKEDWDIIADTDFKHISKVTFTTPHCGEVEFVKVVRCKDCKHRNTVERSPYYGYCVKTKLFPKPDWFCKDGERSEE